MVSLPYVDIDCPDGRRVAPADRHAVTIIRQDAYRDETGNGLDDIAEDGVYQPWFWPADEIEMPALPAAVPAGQSAAPANVTAPALGEPVSE